MNVWFLMMMKSFTRVYETQGNLDIKPEAQVDIVTSQFKDVVPSPQLTINQNVDNGENDVFGELSMSSGVKCEVDYGIWFAKADGSEKCQDILQKIKNRPALGDDEKAKVTEQCNKYYINERTDGRHVLVGIEGVILKLYRNWQRDLTKTVMYEILYRHGDAQGDSHG